MRFHLFPFRTQKLSSFTSTILGGWPPGKIDNADIKEESTDTCAFFTYSSLAQSVERVTVNHDAVGSSPTGGAIKKSHHQVAFFYCTCTINTVINSHASPTEPGEVGGKACFAPLLHQKICKKFFDVIVAVLQAKLPPVAEEASRVWRSGRFFASLTDWKIGHRKWKRDCCVPAARLFYWWTAPFYLAEVPLFLHQNFVWYSVVILAT